MLSSIPNYSEILCCRNRDPSTSSQTIPVCVRRTSSCIVWIKLDCISIEWRCESHALVLVDVSVLILLLSVFSPLSSTLPQFLQYLLSRVWCFLPLHFSSVCLSLSPLPPFRPPLCSHSSMPRPAPPRLACSVLCCVVLLPVRIIYIWTSMYDSYRMLFMIHSILHQHTTSWRRRTRVSDGPRIWHHHQSSIVATFEAF